MMTQNDFYIAIKEILEKALNSGWQTVDIEELAHDAVDEYLYEINESLSDAFPKEES